MSEPKGINVSTLPSRPGKGSAKGKLVYLWHSHWRTLDGIYGWYKSNREYNRTKGHLPRKELRSQIIDLLGARCIICGFDDQRALQIDHIEGGGYKHRKFFASPTTFYKYVLDNPSGFQLLCANHNAIKRIVNQEHRRPVYVGAN